MPLYESKERRDVAKGKLYLSADHPTAMQAAIKAFHGREELCDVVLCAGNRQEKAHRLVLAASCPYFEAMFTSELAECRQEKIYLQGVDAEALKVLFDFIYSGEIEVTELNVQNLLAASALWQLVPVINFCCQFLQERIEADNCTGILVFADDCGCRDLFNSCQKFILQHFSEVIATDEFVSLSETLLVDMLKSDELHVRSEDEVLDGILRWAGHDTTTRDLYTVLQHVKLPLIKWKVLAKKLTSSPLVVDSPACLNLLADVQRFHLQPDLVSSSRPDFSHCTPRKFVTQGTLVYVVGGETHPGRTTVGSVQTYDPHTDTWEELGSLKVGRRGAGVALMDGLLYVCGGSDGLDALCSVECYDPRTGVWSTATDMSTERSSVGVAAVGGCLYAVGGYNGFSACLQSVEQYSCEEDKWTVVADMNIARSMACVGVLDNLLVAIGGYDGSSDLCSCEMYDTLADEWTVMADMNYCRCMAGVAAIDGRLYVVGGCDQSQSLASVEMYEPGQRRWLTVSAMSQPRSGLGCAVVGPQLYAIGGHTSSGYCSSVESYSHSEDKWHPVASMPNGKRRFGCCS